MNKYVAHVSKTANIMLKHLKINQFNKCPKLLCCQSFPKLQNKAFKIFEDRIFRKSCNIVSNPSENLEALIKIKLDDCKIGKKKYKTLHFCITLNKIKFYFFHNFCPS